MPENSGVKITRSVNVVQPTGKMSNIATKSKKWLCSDCKNLLGFTDRVSVRIKYKDLYITVEGGRVSLLCRRCGATNVLEDPDYLAFLADRTQKHFEGKK